MSIQKVGTEIKEYIISDFSKSKKYTKHGWVYIAKLQTDDSIIKIGLTKSIPEDRIKEINRIFHPGMDKDKSKTKLHYTRLTSDCRKIEKEMHSLFDQYKLKGEWFKLHCGVAKQNLDILINNLDTPHLHNKGV